MKSWLLKLVFHRFKINWFFAFSFCKHVQWGSHFLKKEGVKPHSCKNRCVLLPNGSLKNERRCKDRQKIGIIKVASLILR